MVCDACVKKLSKCCVQDVWRAGARNLTDVKGNPTGEGRTINENLLLSTMGKDGKFNPSTRRCLLCKGQIHQWAHYCQDCAYKKGICARCGKRVLKTAEYKMSTK